jgi:hypothetical protein
MVKSNKKSMSHKKSRKIRKQPLYQMKGCASRKNRSSGCNKCKKMHMYGTCAYNGTCTCPCECHRKRAQKGGCGCGLNAPVQTGGSANNYPMPGPFVGNPWRPNVWGWPGVDGISGDRNYLEYNNYHVDPQTQDMPYNFKNGWWTGGGTRTRRNKVGGWTYSSSSSSSSSSTDKPKKLEVLGKGVKGKKHAKKGKTLKRGGGLFPQALANISNDLMYNFNSAYTALNGQPAPVNPAPYMDQITQKPVLM